MGKQRLQFTGSYMNNTAKWMRSHSHVLSVLSLSRNESVNRDQPIPIVRSDRSTWPLRSESGIWIRFVHVPRHRVYIARGHGGVDPLGMPHEGSEQKASLPHFLNQMASSDPTLITRSYEFCLLLTNLRVNMKPNITLIGFMSLAHHVVNSIRSYCTLWSHAGYAHKKVLVHLNDPAVSRAYKLINNTLEWWILKSWMETESTLMHDYGRLYGCCPRVGTENILDSAKERWKIVRSVLTYEPRL